MEQFDYIIVGAGSAGCVLANRLSANPAHRVLLIEAGPPDKSIFISMPKGIGKLKSRPDLAWLLPVEAHEGNGFRQERWMRGKTLGGCSSVNGMTYVRGQPEDYDTWERMGLPGWGWKEIGACFRSMEDHAMGDDGERGVGGLLHLEQHPSRNPLNAAMIDAAACMGVPRRDDYNRPDQFGMGPMISNIKRGRRMSASVAFLRPALHRANLRVVTDTLVHRVLFDGTRAVGVACATGPGPVREYRAIREVIISAGALKSPQLLQLSGIGPAAHLREHGIAVVADRPGVGANLAEHWMAFIQYRLKQPLSVNREFSGLRLVRNMVRYLATGTGPMATGSHEVTGFLKTEPHLERPDAQVIAAPFSWKMTGTINTTRFEPTPGVQMMGYPLRPESRGSVMLRSADPHELPLIRPNYLATENDRASSVRVFRLMRELFRQAPLAPFIDAETYPGAAIESDDDILSHFRQRGFTGYHACGTCKMGHDAMAVVDERLRVIGVQGLRVMDTSVMPTMVSGNTNGPVMAMAWRAADLMIEDASSR